MANWKKMAEAFGRAMSKSRTPNSTTKAVRNSYETDLNNYLKDPESKARAESFYKGQAMGDVDEATIRNKIGTDKWRANRGGAVTQRRNNLEDAATDEALQRDFDQGFEEALKKRGDKVRSAYTLEGHEDLSNQAADNATNEIRRIAIEMLKKGEDIGDVLRILRGE